MQDITYQYFQGTWYASNGDQIDYDADTDENKRYRVWSQGSRIVDLCSTLEDAQASISLQVSHDELMSLPDF